MSKEDAAEAALDAMRERVPPEFLNRLDGALVFNRLDREHMRSIVDSQLAELTHRASALGVELVVAEDARNWLAQHGYSEAYGARPLRRLIVSQLENEVARALLRADPNAATTRAGDDDVVRLRLTARVRDVADGDGGSGGDGLVVDIDGEAETVMSGDVITDE